uniref:Integrase, catalytic region, zinc finger, CCHC-type, peptidase aspartic, catalytic n=1 Tax=Tanacetum cinerariifolium TaxID=118510 RepID=A0A6L2JES6_TANCI|nr:hypothetical protein [Tanacetum cinerariifolium]
MSTQQDIYTAGFESRPPMLNKENYVPWSSRLLCYAKSRPNGKLIHNSIINGPYIRRMIPEPGDTNRDVPVNETFHVQTDDELTEKELKQIEADDQAVQTILLGLSEDIYVAVDSCETAQEIWLRVQQMMKGSDIGIQEKKAKLFNEWEMLTSYETESIESYYHCFLKLMNDMKWNRLNELKAERLAKIQDPLALMENSNNPYVFSAPHQDQPSFNQNYIQQTMPNFEDITDPTTAMNMTLALIAKAFRLNYSTPTNNNQRISSNPRNWQIAQSENLTGYNDVQNIRNQNGLIGVQGNGNQNQIGNGNLVAARAERNAAGQNGNQIRCYNCRGVADLDKIEEVNANCISMANLQQASTSGTQSDKAPVYDSDGSAKVHDYENYDDNEIFNMFTQEEQYTELLEPIPDQHQILTNSFQRKNQLFPFFFEEKRKLKSDFNTREDELLDKQIQLKKKIKKLINILVKMGQSIQTIHMLSPKPDSFYHTKQKMALGYQNPFYLKQAQKKQQSLYDGKVLLEKHDPPVVHDSEETLQLAQEKTHNWSSSAHQELYKIVKVENFPIVNHVDAKVQNFEILFLKEAVKFVGDFKSLAKEADESLAKHKALELEIERLLRAVVSQDIISVVQNESVVDTSDL